MVESDLVLCVCGRTLMHRVHNEEREHVFHPYHQDFITVEDILDQIRFSSDTFGPGRRTKGITEHIAKELQEIRDDPEDGVEWIDVLILALDGAWRFGYTPGRIAEEYRKKMATNKARKWPKWHPMMGEDTAIEHIRDEDPQDLARF